MISGRDQLINAMGNNASRIIIDKASIASVAAGNFVSLWRATGQPGQGAIPAAAAVCDHTLTGAMGFTQQTAPATSYLAQLEGANSNSAMTLEIHDRLMHMGGLNGTLATLQTVNVDINANLATLNLDARKGDANFSDVQWWLEWYTATGGTAVTATIGATYSDGTSANISASLAATRPAGFMLPINGLIPAAQSGKFIRDIDSVTLSATTGAAGSFGVTATRFRGSLVMPLANLKAKEDWAGLGLPDVANSACLFPIVQTSTTSTGAMRGTGKLAHG